MAARSVAKSLWVLGGRSLTMLRMCTQFAGKATGHSDSATDQEKLREESRFSWVMFAAREMREKSLAESKSVKWAASRAL